MDEMRMLKIIEQFSREGLTEVEDIKIIRVPDGKTVFVEKTGGMGRSILFKEYEVDGKIYWAGYSSRNQIVYVSQAA